MQKTIYKNDALRSDFTDPLPVPLEKGEELPYANICMQVTAPSPCLGEDWGGIYSRIFIQLNK